MNESFLHYIWQFQYFVKQDLCLTSGESLTIFQPGISNTNAGPDFSGARIAIDRLEWRGTIELHVRASEWYEHGHHHDPAYENVILHVVFENDKPVMRTDGTHMPTLVLRERLDWSLWDRYRKLITSPESIPCARDFPRVDELHKVSMLDKTLVERMDMRAQEILGILKETNNDWEETCYRRLLRNFGFHVNTEPMARLAQIIPYRLILKHANNRTQVEALLLGAGGFLEAVASDQYVTQLKQEYSLLATKYSLHNKQLAPSQWRFLRLRPANFPTLRLAQAATLLTSHKNIASHFLHAASFQALASIFELEQSGYWLHHYHFGKAVKKQIAPFGKSSGDNILINTVVPLLAAYGRHYHDDLYLHRATDILQHLPPENNRITRIWQTVGMSSHHAFDSQALLSLYDQYCLKGRCLQCVIGSSILRSSA